MVIRCLSLWNPWAVLHVTGEKRNETRNWPTRHRGPLAIHATKKWSKKELDIARRPPFTECLHKHGYEIDRLPLGMIVGVVNVIACYQTENVEAGLTEQERAFGNYGPDRFAWITDKAIAFKEPIKFTGQQGMFSVDIPDELIVGWK